MSESIFENTHVKLPPKGEVTVNLTCADRNTDADWSSWSAAVPVVALRYVPTSPAPAELPFENNLGTAKRGLFLQQATSNIFKPGQRSALIRDKECMPHGLESREIKKSRFCRPTFCYQDKWSVP